MAVDEVDELVQEISQHPASKSLPGSYETAHLRDLSDTQKHLTEQQELCSKLVIKIDKLVPHALRDFEAMVHENHLLRQKLQANRISLDDVPDFKPDRFQLPGAAETPTSPSFSTTELMTVSGQNFHGRGGRRKSALGMIRDKKRKSSLGNEEELVEGLNGGLLAVRPTTPQSKDMADVTEEELEKRQKREQQKKDMQKIKNWTARNKIQRSKSQDQLSTNTSSVALGELTLDQQVEQEGKVFGSPEALKDEVRRALHKEEFSLAQYYKTTGWIQAIARSYIFEIFTLILIGFNCLWMSIDADLNDETLLPRADPIFQVAENVFCFGFTFELVIRFMALKKKKKCLKDPWFLFDALLVILMIFEVWGVYIVMLVSGGQSVSVFQNATILRILRVLRLLRTARMAKILRTMPELMLLIKGIVVATRSVFFTLALLGIFIYVFSIIFMQLTRDTPVGNKYFSGFDESMLTLLLDTVLPDLSVFMREIMQEGWVTATVMMIFILLGSVTMMNMLVGVLVEVIKTVSEIEREQMEVSFVKKIFSDMITKLNLDADGDNTISREEFDTLLSKPEAAKALLNIGVDVVGLVDYRDVLFGKEGEMSLSFAEFMEAILELRGTNSAKVKDIVDLRKFLSQETGAIYELVATVTAGMDDDASSTSSFGGLDRRTQSKRSTSKINEEC